MVYNPVTRRLLSIVKNNTDIKFNTTYATSHKHKNRKKKLYLHYLAMHHRITLLLLISVDGLVAPGISSSSNILVYNLVTC